MKISKKIEALSVKHPDMTTIGRGAVESGVITAGGVTGAAIGAVIGSVVLPGVGTAIGAGVGVAIGVAVGGTASKKVGKAMKNRHQKAIDSVAIKESTQVKEEVSDAEDSSEMNKLPSIVI